MSFAPPVVHLFGMNLKDRTAALIEAFRQVYPNAHCELVFANPLQLLVATVLSAQCTDKRVNLVTETLFKKYRTAADFAQVGQEELEEAIRSTGFLNFFMDASEVKKKGHGLKVPDNFNMFFLGFTESQTPAIFVYIAPRNT